MADPSRELRVETLVDAPRDHVWAVLADLSRMPEWSPELVRVVPLLPGGLRRGQQYLGINRRKLAFWPTRNVVAALDPGHTLAWDTRSSGARWIFELTTAGEQTRVVHRRPVRRLTLLSKVFAGAALGGAESHADELESGMGRTLAGLKAAAEV